MVTPASTPPLSDAELVDATRALEKPVGCYVWMLVPLAAVIGGGLYGAGPAVLSCIACSLLCWSILRVRALTPAIKQAQLAEAELNRRYHIDTTEQDEADASKRLANDPTLDAVLLYEARSLPGGGHHFARIELGVASRIAVRSTPFLSSLWSDRSAYARMRRADSPLTAADAGRIRARLATFMTSQLPAPTLAVMDGMPCSLAIFTRDDEPRRATANLAGLRDAAAEHPLVLLLELMVQLEARTLYAAAQAN